jgi:zeaxanthin glucosyltransferase
MAKILILVWPEASAYNATFRLARVLRGRGHEVVYAVPAAWEERITQQGFRPVRLEDVGLSALHAPAPPGQARDVARHLLREQCARLRWVATDGYDLVLLYYTLWFYAPILRRLGVPYVAANPCLASAWSLEIPPVFSRLQPLTQLRWLNPVQNAGAWLALRYLGAFHHRYRGIIPARFDSWASRRRDLAATTRHFWSAITEARRMPLYAQWLRLARREGEHIGWGDYGHRLAGSELLFGPQALDFARRRPLAERLYVGACVDTERREEAFDWAQLDTRKPLVYCAIGSHGRYWNPLNRARLVEAVVEAFRARPACQLLLQAPDPDDLEGLRPLPGNILVAPWFPQLQILARASLMISHGGFGTLREALFYGVPLIVFPCGVDQRGNAARVAYHGVGLAGDIRRVTPQTIAHMLDTILANPAYRDNAQTMSHALQADNGCETAVAFLERTL